MRRQCVDHMRIRLTRLVAMLLVAPLAAAGASPAQQTQLDITDHLAKISTTLERIAELLARQSESDDLDLLITRVQLGVSQVSEAARRLEGAETRREALQDRKSQLELQLEMNRSRSERGFDQNQPPADLENLTRTWTAHLTRVNSRIAVVSAEIADLQGRVAELVEEVEAWQAILDRRLAGR